MDRLKAKRAARRAQATIISTEATALIESGCSDRLAIRKVLDKLMASREELSKIDAQVEDAVPVEELERYESAARYNDQTIEALTRLTYRLEELSVSDTAQPAPSAAVSTPEAPTTVPSQISGPRLPTLTIKPFYGDVCQWTSFWEQFNGAVHTNQALTTTEKFKYLRNYLEGDAAAAIAGLPTTEACFESAIQQLQDKFGDKRRIVQRHFRNLRELQHVTSLSEERELRRFYDCVQLNVRCLNLLDVPTSSFAAMLYDILLEVLPEEIVVAFHRHVRLKKISTGMTSSSSGDENETACWQLEQLLRSCSGSL
ncbi:uncharacterized protein LOC144180011 [Haemaphysalis longicornis]